MRTKRRKLPGAESVVFAPPAAGDHPLKIAQFRAWRVKEPVSERRSPVVRQGTRPFVLAFHEDGAVASL